jgi:cytochrome b pre-mRNA-processing protein 3
MYKKDLSNQLRGSIFAYDEGFFSDDTVLAGAVWRNMFEGRSDVDFSEIEQIVHYIRSQLYALDKLSDQDFTHGRFAFIDPSKRYQPFTPSEEAELLEELAQMRIKLESSPVTHTQFK